VGEIFVIYGNAMLAQHGDGAFQVHSVTEDNGGDDQVETACPIALVFEAAVAQVTLAVEEDGAGERVSGSVHASIASFSHPVRGGR